MYTLEVRPLVWKDMKGLPGKARERALIMMESLEKEPRPSGCKKLVGSKDRWRIRFGDYRILYKVDDEMKHVLVFRVLHRKDVYR